MRSRALFFAAGLALIASGAMADTQDKCEVYDIAAKGAMEKRQNGVPLADAMKVLNKRSGENAGPEAEYAVGVLRLAFTEAYKTPRYRTESMKKDAITDFRNQFYSECLSIMAERKK